MRPLILLLLFLCTFSSCRDTGKLLPGKWDVTELHYPGLEKFLSKLSGGDANSMSPSTLVQGDFLNMHEDGSFTSLSFGTIFIHGQWDWNPGDKTIRFRSDGQEQRKVLRVNSVKPGKLVVEWLDQEKPDTVRASAKPVAASHESTFKTELTLVKNNGYYPDPQNDYTSPENNAWRKKPAAPERYQQIKNRIRQSIWFSIQYLSYCIDNGQESVSLKPIMLPLVLEYNGYGINPKMDPSWVNIFFDEADASVGYGIISDALPKTVDWHLKGTALAKAVLEAMLKNI